MVERTGIELVAKVDDKEIEGLGRTFQWVRRQTEDVRRSLVGLNTVAERQAAVNRLIRDEKKSSAEAERVVARTERRTLEDRAGGMRRMMSMGQQAGRTVPMAGRGAGGIARGVTGAVGRGVAGRVAGGAGAAGGLGAGAMLAGGLAAGALVGGGLLAARGFGMAKEQATAFEALERRVRAVGVAYTEIQRAVQDVGVEFGVSRMEIAAASEAFTQFAGQIDDVDAFAMAMGGVVAAARGFGLRPEQLAGEIGQFQRLIGFDVTQEPAQTQRFLLQMASVMGSTQMGGRGAEFIKATERLAAVAADITGVVAPERVLALQAAIGAEGRQGLIGERGVSILERVHSAITRPGGEVQQGFLMRALSQGRDPFQTLFRQERGIFGEDVLEDILRLALKVSPGFEVPTLERVTAIQAGAEPTPQEAAFATLASQMLGIPRSMALELVATLAPGGEIKDIEAAIREVRDAAKKAGVDLETLGTDTKVLSSLMELVRGDGEVSKENLQKIIEERGQIETLLTTEQYLNNINAILGEKLLPVAVSISEVLNATLGRFVGGREEDERRGARPLRGAGALGIVIPEVLTKEEARAQDIATQIVGALSKLSVTTKAVVEMEGAAVASAQESVDDALDTMFESP